MAIFEITKKDEPNKLSEYSKVGEPSKVSRRLTSKKYVLVVEGRLLYLDRLQQVESLTKGTPKYSLLENTLRQWTVLQLQEEHKEILAIYLSTIKQAESTPVKPKESTTTKYNLLPKTKPQATETSLTITENGITYNITKPDRFLSCTDRIEEVFCPWCSHASTKKGLPKEYDIYSEFRIDICNKYWRDNGICGNFKWRKAEFEKQHYEEVEYNHAVTRLLMKGLTVAELHEFTREQILSGKVTKRL